MRGLAGQTVLVTGATGLVGTAISQRLAEEGARVVVTSRGLGKAQAWIEAQDDPSPYVAAELDLADEASCRSLLQRLGEVGPTALVANASLREGLATPFGEVGPGQFADMVRVDAGGHLVLARGLVDRGGRSVVFLSSVYAVLGVDHGIYPQGGLPTPVQYAAVKAGLLGLTRYLAALWGPQGVRVNAVVSGGVRAADRQSPEFVGNYSRKTMLGRMAEPTEVAAAVAFLLSDDASYITGAELAVDGGMTAW